MTRDPEKKKATERRYRERHREEINERERIYRKNHPEKVREGYERYKEKNLDKINERKRKYYQAHKEKYAEYHKKYRQEHREEIREKYRSGQYKYGSAPYSSERRRRTYLKHNPNAAKVPKLSNEEKAQILAMHQIGNSIASIARTLHRPENTIWRYLKKQSNTNN